VILNIRRCRRPVIAALNGTTAGAGAVIATACDLRIASETAKIAYLFVRVGLSGADMGASWMLPRLVGLGRATELLMTGDFISAEQALAIGLYQRVVPAERLLPEATGFAERLGRGPGPALAITKQALDAEATMDLERALAHEAEVQAALMEHPNFREAYEAFRAKREPAFRE
jgi:enoyl-CoA hydratase/carnithine racemase